MPTVITVHLRVNNESSNVVTHHNGSSRQHPPDTRELIDVAVCVLWACGLVMAVCIYLFISTLVLSVAMKQYTP